MVNQIDFMASFAFAFIEPQMVFYLYVVNEAGQLVGVLSLRQLLTVIPQDKIAVDFFHVLHLLGDAGNMKPRPRKGREEKEKENK